MIIIYTTNSTGSVTTASAIPNASHDLAERLKMISAGLNASLGWESCVGHVIEVEDSGLLAYLALNGAADFTAGLI